MLVADTQNKTLSDTTVPTLALVRSPQSPVNAIDSLHN